MLSSSKYVGKKYLRVEEDEMWSRAFDLASSGEFKDANNILTRVGVEYPEIWMSLGSDPERYLFLREYAFKTYHSKRVSCLS